MLTEYKTLSELKVKIERLQKENTHLKNKLSYFTDFPQNFYGSFENSELAIAVYKAVDKGENFVFTYFNSKSEQLSGVKRESVLGKPVTEAFPGVIEFGLFDLFKKVYKTGKPAFHPVTLYKDEKLQGYRENFVSKLPNGEIIAIYFDRDKHKKLAEQNKEHKDTIIEIFNSLNNYIFVADFEGNIQFANSALLLKLNYSPEKIKTKTIFDISHTELKEKIKDTLQKIINGESIKCNIPLLTKKGNLIPTETNIYLGKWHGEKAIFTIATDLTETNNLNNIINVQIEALKAAANGIVITNNEGNIIWTNPAFTKLTGYSAEEAKNKNTGILKSGMHDKNFYKNLWDTIKSGKVWHGIIKNKRKDGSLYDEEIIITPVKNSAGDITNYIAIQQDITKQEHEKIKRNVLFEIGILLVSSKQLDELLKVIHHKINEVVPAENCYVALYDSKNELISFPYFVDEFDAPPKPRAKKKGFTEFVLKTGKPLILNDKIYNKLIDENEVNIIGTPPASWIGVPFSVSSKSAGVLVIQSYKNEFIYSEEDKNFIVTVANQIGSIIERKLNEEKLNKEQYLFQLFMDNIPESIYFKDKKGRFLKINKTSAQRVGLNDPSEAVGKTDYDFFDKKTARQSERENLQLLKTGNISKKEKLKLYRDGIKRWIESTKIPMKDKEGNINGIFGITRDITERKEWEEKIKQSEERFRTITQTATDAILGINEKGKITVWNEAAHRIFGYSQEEAIGKDIHALIVPGKYKDVAYKGMKKFFRIGKGNILSKTLELSALKKDGTEIPIELAISKVKSGNTWNATGIIRDISDRKKYENRLKDKEKRFNDLIKFATIGYYRLDENGEILIANPALVNILGYNSSEDILTQKTEDLFADLTKRKRLLHILKNEEKVYGFEDKWKRQDNSVIDTRESVWTIKDINNNFVYYEGVLEDITEQNQLMEILQESESKYRTLLDRLNEAVYLIADNKFELVNNKFLELLEIDYEDVFSEDFKLTDFVAPKDRNLILERQKELIRQNKKSDNYEFTLITKNGNEKEVEISVTFMDYKGKKGTQGILRDLTAHKQMETQIRHSQKMEAVGTLAAGIAHEINTPSQFINDNLSFLRNAFNDLKPILTLQQTTNAETINTVKLKELAEKADLDFLLEEIPSAIDQSADGIQRIAKIVGAMREFAHEGPKEKIRTDLHKLIESTITISKNTWKYAAELKTDFDKNLPAIVCLPNEFNQVIVNMIVNASHAIEDKFQDTGGKGLIIITTRKMGESVEIKISDNGNGIPEHVISKIFDPFFTTKEVGKGTGQGLAIAYDIIVQKHGGKIFVDSKVGKGTTFNISLPINGNHKTPGG